MRIEEIQITDRYRKDFGDIESLAKSIEELGLLHAVIVDSNNRLIDGERRIRAFKYLGRGEIEARVINVPSLLRAEHDANEFAKQWTVSERVAIAKAIEAEVRERAKERQLSALKQNNDQPTVVPNWAQRSEGRSRDEIAERAGFSSHTTFERAQKVIDQGTPELVEAVDRGEVAVSTAAKLAELPKEEQAEIVARGPKEILQAAKQLMAAESEKKKAERRASIAQQREAIQSGKVEMPAGVFEVIVVDPPWNYGSEYSPDGWRIANPYPEMSHDELKRMHVPAADDSVIFLWTTHAFIWDAKELLDLWGFTYKTTLVWDKISIGMGRWFRLQCEFCLVGIKGKPVWENTTWRDIISEQRREHSRKPEVFYKMVEDITVGRRLEMFSRTERDGWEVVGNDTSKFSNVA